MKVNGHDDIPYMKWKIKFMFETTNQTHKLWPFIGLTKNLVRYLQFNNLGSWNSHWACSNPPLGIDGRGVNASIWGLPATFETEPTASSPPPKKKTWKTMFQDGPKPSDLGLFPKIFGLQAANPVEIRNVSWPWAHPHWMMGMLTWYMGI